MLDVPPFTPTEGAALLAANSETFTELERRELVARVDGHALAVATIAALLAEHPAPTTTELLSRLSEPGGTQAKVGRVLNFYSERLTDPDRYLVAAVSLFARPVTPHQLLAVAAHDVFAGKLHGWDTLRVQAAVGGPLAGLLTWHPDGTITAHPLVRQTFRPLAMGAAQIAVETALLDIPAGVVTDRAQAELVVEAIELLIDAGHWRAANDLYQTRTRNGISVWLTLPAARLGQRAATNFVATPTRRDICHTQLNALAFYLASVGLFAMCAGDLTTASDYLSDAVHPEWNVNVPVDLAIRLHNLAECLTWQGQARAAAQVAAEALTHATTANAVNQICSSHVRLGLTADLGGDTVGAEQQFLVADRLQRGSDHLSGLLGVWWAGFLIRTGRYGPARRLSIRNLQISRHNRWNENVARCQVLLAQLEHNLTNVASHLSAACEPFATAITFSNCPRHSSSQRTTRAGWAISMTPLPTQSRHCPSLRPEA